MYSNNYDTSYDPSIPVVQLGLGLERGRSLATIPALVDSGADATIIPVHFLKQIGALPNGDQWLRTGMGDRYAVRMYPLFLQIGVYTIYANVIGDVIGEEAAIGRDVLNHFIVTLDAPALAVQFLR